MYAHENHEHHLSVQDNAARHHAAHLAPDSGSGEVQILRFAGGDSGCHGLAGYERLLEVLGNADDEEHESMVEWFGVRYPVPFDLDAFEPGKIVFSGPNRRLKRAFGS